MCAEQTDVTNYGRIFSANFYDQPFSIQPSTSVDQQIIIEEQVLNSTGPAIGHCHIFNYQDFKKNPRLGSEKDVKRLSYDFHALNFDVYNKYKNYSKQETLDALKNAARIAKKEHKCFVCCFLSHGNSGKLSVLGDELDINEILKYFSRSECENLKDIPKIFIFQACRGNCYEDGVSCYKNKVPSELTDSSSMMEIPDSFDFLLAYSTYDGKYAIRTSKGHGTFYVDELCRTLEQFSGELDLLEILTIVNYRLAHFFMTENKKKQMPCFTSTLRTKVEFGKSIEPFVSEDTKFFDERRRESRAGSMSTDKPLADKKTYKIQEPGRIKFLYLLNMENNFESCLLDYASKLWLSVTKRRYLSHTIPKWSEDELMDLLKEVAAQGCSKTDCLICFVVCQAKEDCLRDSNGDYFPMGKIVEQFTGGACCQLIKKPKIFIFLNSSPTNLSSAKADSTDSKDNNLIPEHCDLLEVNINIQDANQLKGVIDKFCNIFGNESSEDFLSQLTTMNSELVNDYGFHSDPEKNLAPFTLTSTLTKTLIINKPNF